MTNRLFVKFVVEIAATLFILSTVIVRSKPTFRSSCVGCLHGKSALDTLYGDLLVFAQVKTDRICSIKRHDRESAEDRCSRPVNNKIADSWTDGGAKLEGLSRRMAFKEKGRYPNLIRLPSGWIAFMVVDLNSLRASECHNIAELGYRNGYLDSTSALNLYV
ncbi:unnamed protein product [Protopolystoma xenopodis]|uniref:Uncharacterized protein n=1 Tax=Protopolystoma xenopodis TaxID=117903 RepID=A0A448WDN4_9PLAT|nr:unnamed protein product [Protopolystoma xenopodis]